MAEERLGASFNIDVSQLKAGLSMANKLIRESESEFKAAAAGMDDWSNSEEGLNAKIKSLTDITEVQKKKVDALKEEYQNLIDGGLDPTSKRAVELRTQINNEQAALAKNEAELGRQTAALDDLQNASDDASDAVEDTGEAAKDAGDGFTIAKGAIADLVSKGIQSLVGACKNAISSLAGLAEETREYRENLNKLEAAFETSGFSAFEAQTQYSSLYRVLGDEDKATEASAHLAKLATTQEDLTKWTTICTGVYGAFGDSLPIEGLTEAANEVAKTGELTGVLTDAINWATTDQNVWNAALGEGTAQQKAFAKGIKEGMSAEDAFKEALAACTTEQQRADLITRTLNGLYSESADTFREVNASVMDANTAQDRYNKATAALGEQIEPVMTGIKNGFADIVFQAGELTGGVDFEGLGEKISGAFETFAEDWLPKIMDGIDFVKENVPLVATVVGGLTSAFVAFKVAAVSAKLATEGFTIATKLQAIAQGALNTVMNANPIGLIIIAVTALVAAFMYLWKNCEGFRNFWIGLWDGIKNAAGAVADWFKDTWQKVSDFFVGLWDGIKDAASAAWNGIKAVFGTVAGWFNEKIITPVSKFFSSLWDGFSQKASGAWEKVKNIFSKVAGFFGDLFSKAWEKVKAVFSTGGKIFAGIVDGIESAFKKIVNKIIRGINKVVAIPFNAINKTLDKIRDVSIAGIQPFSGLITRISVPEIPELAKGGVVRGATTAVIGEDGAEAVVPLEKNREWIKAVAEELAAANKQGVVINQTNNYSQAHSRLELYKSKQQTAAAVRLALGTV